MVLQPSNFFYNNRQNNRRASIYFNRSLTYGTTGCQLSAPLSLTANQIFRINLFLNNSSRKSEKTKSSFWLNTFPHLPLTNNVNGSRMGKGIGNLSTWFSQVPGGTILFEFNNLRPGRSQYFISQLQYRLSPTLTTNAKSLKPLYFGLPKSVNVSSEPTLFLN